ncbi:hypothetical protein CC80DRAFT_510979 [Byssothecium circinans]|uniref:Uncharacterized protein n=1 Tax=Byssothecium circinans TaxID=147558 RepID=A0A6A5T893_9PLEO|nr:hypothetical protein CC80DRAFT_510979 [Byssothecium circinans]
MIGKFISIKRLRQGVSEFNTSLKCSIILSALLVSLAPNVGAYPTTGPNAVDQAVRAAPVKFPAKTTSNNTQITKSPKLAAFCKEKGYDEVTVLVSAVTEKTTRPSSNRVIEACDFKGEYVHMSKESSREDDGKHCHGGFGHGPYNTNQNGC